MNKRNMAKTVVLATLSCLLVVVLAGGACVPKGAKGPTAEQPLKLRYSGTLPITAQTSKEQVAFANKVKERTGGRVIIETYLSGELYKQTEGIDAVKSGAVDMHSCGLTIWAPWNPIFEFDNLFFLVTDADQTKKARDKMVNVLDPQYMKQNAKLLHLYYYGGMAVCSTKPIARVTDLKGLKIRGTGVACNENLKVLGSVPVSLSSEEVYDAIGKRAIDGAISGWSTFASRKWYEIAKNYVGPVYFSVWAAWINVDVWNSIPKDIQDVIMKAGQEIEEMSYQQANVANSKDIETLKKGGATVHTLTPQEMQEWRAAVAPVYDKWVKSCEEKGLGKEAKELITMFEEASR